MSLLDDIAAQKKTERDLGKGDTVTDLNNVLSTLKMRDQSKAVGQSNFTNRAISAGQAQWKSSLNYFDSIVSSELGLDDRAKKTFNEAENQAAMAQRFREANGVKDWNELVDNGSASDWFTYFAATGIEIAPHVAATMASGGVGGLAALGTKGMMRLAGKKAKNVAKDRFVKNAATLGAFGHEYAAAAGDTYAFTGDKERSLIAAAPFAAVNLWSQVAFAKALTKQAAGTANQQAAKSYFRKVADAAAIGAAREGLTEELQTEFQLLAKAAGDRNFDFFGDDANTMRVQSAVTGAVLGKTISGTGAAVSVPIGNALNDARQGSADAQQQFEEGAREAEQNFVPETEAQLITQLDELEAGRGREAVQVTSGPLPEAELETRGMQQIELDNEQGVLIVRNDQDAAEVKAAFESGSRDVLGNGTVNKPEGGTEVVRSVNADGSRGADVVVTPDTEQAVTQAQEAKSDINQTETVSAQQAIQERQPVVSDYTDEEVAAQFPPVGTVDVREAKQMSELDTDQQYREYKSGLSVLDDADPYRTEQAARTRMEGELIPRRIAAAQEAKGANLTDDEISSLTDRFEVVETADGFVIREYGPDAGAFDTVARTVKIASGTTPYKGKSRLRHPEQVKKLVDNNQQAVSKDDVTAVRQVFGVVDKDGKTKVLDIKAVAEAGWRALQSEGQTAKTESERLQLGLARGVGDLAQSGYQLFEGNEAVNRNTGEIISSGNIDLTLNNSKTFGRDGPTVGPVRAPEVERAGLQAANRIDGRAANADRNVAAADRMAGPEFSRNEGEYTADAQDQDTPRFNDAELQQAANKSDILGSWDKIPSKAGSPVIKILNTTKKTALLGRVATILSNALNFTNTKVLVLDNAALDFLIANVDDKTGKQINRLDPKMRSLLEAVKKDNPMGRSIFDPSKDYGIVFVNTNAIEQRFTTKVNGKDKLDIAKSQAYTAFVLSHELGHQYFESTVTNLPKADKLALNTLFEQSSAADWYKEKYGDPRTAVNEWFSDRVAALSMQIIGKKSNAQMDSPFFFNQPVDNAFKASSVDVTGTSGPQLNLFADIAAEQQAASDLVRDADGQDVRRVRNVARDIAQKLRKIYETWRDNFAKFKGRPLDADPMFNEWLANVVNRNPQQLSGIQQTIQGVESSTVDPKPDPARTLETPREGLTPAAKISDFGEFDQFLDGYSVPRNRIQLEQTSRRFYEGGVSSMLGRLFFSAHEQLSVMGASGKRLANMLYKKSSTIGRDGFLNRSLFKFQQKTGQLSQILPNDKERATQVLDEFGVWRENGADLNNIPESIRPYRIRLTNFFDTIGREMREVNPEFELRENYFMHLYDPEKLMQQSVQDNLVRLLVENEGYLPEEANATVQGMRAKLMAASQNTDATGVTAHSQEERKFGNLTYAQLREAGALYDPMTAVMKYTREMTKATEFHKMFGGMRAVSVPLPDGNFRVVEKYYPDAKIRETIDELPADQRAEAKHIVDGMLGRLGNRVNPEWSKAQSWLMTIQFMATLTFATLASLPDIMMPALRSREMSGLGMNVEQIARMFNSQDRVDMYQFAEDMGTITQDVVHEAITAGYGSEWMDPKARKVSDTFFKFIGLEHWTRMTRVIGTSMARDFIVKHATDPNQRSARYLEELGIDAPTVQAWLDSDRDFNTAEGQAVQMAILRFTDESILRPNSAERPTYMSDPRFMLFGQLKGFFYSFGQKVVGGLYREMQSRRAAGEPIPAAMTPMIIAGVALMPLAAVALGVREELKYEDGQEPTARMSSSEYLFELVSRSGFLGPLEIPKSMFDAGEYGLPFWAAPLGPSVATGFDLAKSDGFDALEELVPVYNQFN